MENKRNKSKHTIKVDNDTWNLVQLLGKSYNKDISKTIEDLINNNADGIKESVREKHCDKHITKHLRFELSMKEYSDFWLIGSILKLPKKKDILLRMINIIKKQNNLG